MLRVYRRDSTDAEMAGAEVATDTPATIPIYGAKRWKVHVRGPSGPVQVQLYERLASGSSNALVFDQTGTRIDDDTTPVSGELGAIVVTNGATAQRPEILIELVEDIDS